MALTNRVVKRIDLAHEPGQWLEVRLPSMAILDRARQARSRQAMEMMAGMDLSHFRDLRPQEPTASAEPDYDWQTLLASCLLAWSYDAPVTPENVAELDLATVRAALAVLVPQDSEAEQKNA